jgi:hypothetical protein
MKEMDKALRIYREKVIITEYINTTYERGML